MFEDGKLKEKSLVYLAGAISAAKDNGAGWRTDISPHLLNLGYQIFNPVFDQPRMTGISREGLQILKETDIDLYREACTKIVDMDLMILTKSKLVVVKIDESTIKGSGTFGEMTVAHLHNIPVLAWIDLPMGVADVPSWAFGCITHYTVHERDFYKMIPSAKALEAETRQQWDDAYDHWKSDT